MHFITSHTPHVFLMGVISGRRGRSTPLNPLSSPIPASVRLVPFSSLYVMVVLFW
jgi:hypothetical protein